MEKHFTLGLPSHLVKETGILPLLFQNGIRQLAKIKMSGSLYKQEIEHGSYRTEYFKVRHFHSTVFEANEKNIDLRDLLNDLIAHNFPLDRQVAKIEFVDLNGHIITLQRRGWHEYRASYIDGKSVLDSFTRQDIEKIWQSSVFSKITKDICGIQRKKTRDIEFHCDWVKAEANDTAS